MTSEQECDFLLFTESTHLVALLVVRVLLVLRLFDVFNHPPIKAVTVILILCDMWLHHHP